MSDTIDTKQNDTVEKAPAKPKKRLLRLGIGAVVGASLGFAYYYFVGCESGGCPITSNPVISTGYGAIFGALFTWS